VRAVPGKLRLSVSQFTVFPPFSLILFSQVEVAVKKILSGMKVGTSGALRNPESLDLFRNIAELQM